MGGFSRRRFLYWLWLQSMALAGGQTLSACGASEPQDPKAATRASPAATAAGDGPAETEHQGGQARQSGVADADTPTPESLPTPDLAVARGGKPRRLVRQALKALGGMERFVQPGDDVIIKPNICVAYRSYEYAATTNPWVVGAVVELALEAGAKRVRVMDYPFGGSPAEAYVRSGIREQVETNGGEMEAISAFKFAPTDLPEGLDLTRCTIYQEVLDADVLINVPIAKHHSLARLTLGMKNLMGTIRNRPMMHQNLGQRLADLSSRIRPALTIVDAVRILMANGPTGGSRGDVRQADTLIASSDIVAADSYAATLFNVDPTSLAYIQAGADMGLGRADLGEMRIEEINVDV
jgi:uncharacterized protein (DUF362 family)